MSDFVFWLRLWSSEGRREEAHTNRRPGRLRKLHRKNTHPARPLRQNRISRLQFRQAIKRIPRRQPSAREGRALQPAQALRHLDQPVLVEGAVLAQGAVEGASEAGLGGHGVERAAEMGLVEEGEDFGADGEAGYFGADGDDFAGAIGGGDYAVGEGEGVLA